ncbi:MAG: cell wall hydrolase [Eubacterium sp.]|nr:cell wall hydrolase [Eubacterium sp.]
MRRIKKCFVLFFSVALLWMMVLIFESVREVKKPEIANKKFVVDYFKPAVELVTTPPRRLPKPTHTPQASHIPQSTQIPSAKGVTVKKIYRLAQLMYAENGAAEDDDCVFLTGIVVVKRMKSKKYPDTLEGVISQKGQYSTYQTGKINCRPDERSLEFAEEILRFNLEKDYPDNLLFQAEFPQGSKIYKRFGHEYFCLE